MKTPISNPVFVLLALVGVAAADLPKKASVQSYSGLVTNSPFTTKVTPGLSPPNSNPLDGYSLIGISPIGNNDSRVTLVRKDKPAERIIVDSDKPNGRFKVLQIIRKTGDPLETVVRLRLDDAIGDVGFDEKMLVIATKATPPKVAKPLSSLPRPRVVAPAR